MKLLITVLIVGLGLPFALEMLHRKVLEINGIPAWIVTVASCLVAALIVTAILVHVTIFYLAAVTALIFFVAHGVLTLIIKPYFPTRKPL